MQAVISTSVLLVHYILYMGRAILVKLRLSHQMRIETVFVLNLGCGLSDLLFIFMLVRGKPSTTSSMVFFMIGRIATPWQMSSSQIYRR